MADSLNQVGKQLKKGQDRGRYNIARYARNFPVIERLRDSFDTTTPFKMELHIVQNQNTKITIIFFEPFCCGGIG